jgi:hypothetical protein
MKKPSLRLRQVFEGPTHFKVVKPLGNPIKIAKKGLSPSLMGRLRKFANGGEATEGAGGDAPAIDTAQMVNQAKQPSAESVESPLVEFPLPDEMQDSVAIPEAAPVAPVVAPAAAPVAIVAQAPAPVALMQDLPIEEKPAEDQKPEEAPPEKLSDLQMALEKIGVDRTQLEKMNPMQRTAALNLGKQLVMQEELNKLEVAAAEGEAGALKAGVDAQAEELKQLNTRAQEARTVQKNILDEMDYLKNPGNYFSRMSTLGQIGSAISLALGAFASGMTGMPNFAQKIFDNAIEQDLAEQKRRSDSLYQRLVAAGHTVEGAEDLVRAQLKLIGASQQGLRAAQVKLPQVRQRMQVEMAKQVNDAVGTMARVANQERTAGAAERRADVAKRGVEVSERRAKTDEEQLAYQKERDKALALEREKMNKQDAGFKQARLNLDARKLDFDKRKQTDDLAYKKQVRDEKLSEEEAQRTFSVAGMPIQSKDKTQARNAEEAVLGESEFIDLAEETLNIFKEHPVAANVWNTTAYNTAKLYLGQLLERYPKVERFRRPLNVTASKVVKSAMGSLQGLESAVFNRPEEVLGAMIQEAKLARRMAISTYARPTASGQEQAQRAIEAIESRSKSLSSDSLFEE